MIPSQKRASHILRTLAVMGTILIGFLQWGSTRCKSVWLGGHDTLGTSAGLAYWIQGEIFSRSGIEGFERTRLDTPGIQDIRHKGRGRAGKKKLKH